MTTRKVSMSGLQFIESNEGFRATPYHDLGGVLTIGFGHKILPGESFTTISRATASNLLAHDTNIAENDVSKMVHVKLNNNQFAALVDFVYNVGGGAFSRSTLLRLLNQEDYNTVPDQLRRWKYDRINGVETVSSDLIKRRNREAALWSA